MYEEDCQSSSNTTAQSSSNNSNDGQSLIVIIDRQLLHHHNKSSASPSLPQSHKSPCQHDKLLITQTYQIIPHLESGGFGFIVTSSVFL